MYLVYPSSCSILPNFYIPKDILLGLEAKKYFWVVSSFYFTAYAVLQVHRSEGPFFGKSKHQNQEIMAVLVYVSQVVLDIVMAVGKWQRFRLFSACLMLYIQFSSCWVNLLWKNHSFAALTVSSLFHNKVNALTSAVKLSLFGSYYTCTQVHLYMYRLSTVILKLYMYVCVHYVWMDVIYEIFKYDSDWKEQKWISWLIKFGLTHAWGVLSTAFSWSQSPLNLDCPLTKNKYLEGTL